MKPARPQLAIGAAVLLAIGLIAAWWWHTYERVERTIDLPPRGEASYNPLYALKIALQAEGLRAESRQRLRLREIPPGPRDTVLILNDPRTLSQRDVVGLLDWVDGGGHLIVRVPPPDRGSAVARPGLLFAMLRLKVLPLPSDCMPLLVPREPQHVEFCGGARFGMNGVDPVLSWGDLINGYVYVRLAHGAGRIDVLSDLDFLTNAKLKDGPHIALTRQLLQPNYGAGIVHLVYAASMPPLWRLLLDRAWMAMLPLLLALLAWLWMRMQRSGPRLPSPIGERRSLLEHVQASGEHLYRYGRAYALHAAALDAFLVRLRRRDPLAAALDGPAQASAIAERTGLSVAEVSSALQSPRPNDAADFRLRIARLVQMRNRL